MTAYAIIVEHPLSGPIQVGKLYRTRECAKSWVSFVRTVWHGLPTKVKAVKVPDPISPAAT